MARISYVEAGRAPREVAQLFAVMEERSGLHVFNLWKTVAHVPAALPHLVKLTNALLAKGKLDAKLREMAILRVAALIDCEYERRAHAMLGVEVGLTERQVAGVEDWAASGEFSDLDRAALRFVDEVTQTARVTDATFARLAGYLDEDGMVELTLVTATYGMIGRVLLVFAVDQESQKITSAAQLKGQAHRTDD